MWSGSGVRRAWKRLWLNDGSCVRLWPTHRNHFWSYRLAADRTADGRPIRMLTIVDEHTRECLAIDVAKRLTSEDVLERPSDLFVRRGVPEYIRSDTGSDFTAKCVREWLGRVGVKTLYIEPGSPWENGYVESFNGKRRDELLKRESFDTLLEAKVLGARWRQDSDTIRPHRAGLLEDGNLTSFSAPYLWAGHVRRLVRMPHMSILIRERRDGSGPVGEHAAQPLA